MRPASSGSSSGLFYTGSRMNQRETVRNLGRRVQALIGRIPRVAGWYLRTIGSLGKLFPDGPWKRRIHNALGWGDWIGVTLPPRTVELAPGVAVKLVPHPAEFDFAALLFRRLPYEAGVFDWLAGREYDTVIEIGANVGVFTLFFTRQYPQARIYAFEPSAAAYRRLLANLAANGEERATTFNCAVSDSTGFIDFFEPSGHLTNGSLDAAFAACFSDNVAKRRALAIGAQCLAPLISGRTLVKLDVEGAEPRVLGAMAGLLRERRPDLLVEVLENTEAALNRLEFLLDGSYSIFKLADSGPVPASRFEAGGFRDFALIARTA
jgi:FkbM family methyltransferase